MKIAGIDPATSTAYCIFDTNIQSTNIKDKIVKYGLIDLSREKFENNGLKLLKYKTFITKLIIDNNIDMVVLEDYFFNSKFCSGSNLNGAIRAVIWLVCAELNKPYEIINITKWKTHITGQSRPEKVMIKKLTKTVAEKEYVKIALEKKYNIVFKPEDLVYDMIKDKMVPFKYDVSDSIGITLYHVECGQKDKDIKIAKEKQAQQDLKEYASKNRLLNTARNKKAEEKAAEKTAKDAAKAAEKTAKDAAKAAEKAAKDAAKAAEKAEKDAVKAATKTAEKAAKDAAKAAAKAATK